MWTGNLLQRVSNARVNTNVNASLGFNIIHNCKEHWKAFETSNNIMVKNLITKMCVSGPWWLEDFFYNLTDAKKLCIKDEPLAYGSIFFSDVSNDLHSSFKLCVI